MKKITFVIAAMLIISLQGMAQAPAWTWATIAYGTDNDYASSIVTDASGNVYMTGYYYSYNIHFGSTVLNNNGTVNLFVAKYNSSGTVQWAKGAGGTNVDEANSVAVDASGNVYICGTFKSPIITFGSTNLINSSIDSGDIFIAKYDVSGNVLWAKSAGGTNTDVATAVTTDASGNVYMTGSFNSSVITFGSITLINTGNRCMFLVKYDSLGNVVWAKSAGGAQQAWATALSLDAADNIYVAGDYGSADIYFDTLHLSHFSCLDLFLVKYDSSGMAQWAKSAGTCGLIHPNSLATDASGNIYLAGSYNYATIVFDSDTLTNADNSGTTYDAFLVKYNSIGNVVWAKDAGGTLDDEANSVAVNSIGNVFLAGDYSSATITFDTATLTGSSYSKIFLVKYDTSGNVAWAKTSVGTNNDKANSVATDAIGDIYVTGIFAGTAMSFGAMTLLNIIPNGTTDDIFLAKINSPVTDIQEAIPTNSSVLIYPNPANTILNIHCQLTIDNCQLMITDVLGNEVYAETLTGIDNSISIAKWSEGVYFYEIRTGLQIPTSVRGKFVVQK